MMAHEPVAPHETADAATVSSPEAADAAAAPTLPRSKRKRPLHTMSISPDGWARLDEIARRWGLSRSGAVERLIRESTMPRDLR
jgi:hypothetical protein